MRFSPEELTSEVVQSIAALSAEAVSHDLKIIRPEAEPKDVYYLLNSRTGATERIVAHKHPINVVLHDLRSLEDWISGDSTNCGKIFVGRNAIVAYRLNAAGQRETAKIELNASEPFLFLAKKEPLQQRPFWMALRTKLRDCLSSDFVAAVSSIKWGVSSDGASTVAVGKESLSRSAVASIRTEAAIPDDIVVTFPVFSNEFARNRHEAITCAVDLSPEAKTFALIPHRNHLDDAVANTIKSIAETIQTATGNIAEVFVGTPT